MIILQVKVGWHVRVSGQDLKMRTRFVSVGAKRFLHRVAEWTKKGKSEFTLSPLRCLADTCEECMIRFWVQ